MVESQPWLDLHGCGKVLRPRTRVDVAFGTRTRKGARQLADIDVHPSPVAGARLCEG